MDQFVEKISRSNKALNILLNFNRKIFHFISENDIAKEVCRIAVEELECDSAWFSYSSDTSGKACIPVVSYEERPAQKDDTNKNASETKTQKADKAIETPQSMHIRMNLRKVIRILCLLSICCVLFENWHRAILIIYHHFTSDGITLIPGLITLPLSILSAILLTKFVKAEFVQYATPSGGDTVLTCSPKK